MGTQDVTTKRLPRAEDKRRWDLYVANGYEGQKTANAIGLTSYSSFRIWMKRMRAMFEKEGIDPAKIPAKWWKKYLAEDPQLMTKSSDDPEIVVDKDAIKEARAKQELDRLKREHREAVLRAVAAEDLRAGVFGLIDPPLEPLSFQPAKPSLHPSPETIIVDLSDWHYGEVISYAEMDGVNSYNPQIAGARAERCFQAILDLATKHWAGPPPERLIILLGGDMISGEIHEELKKTNGLMAIPAVREVVKYLRAGVQMLHDHLSCPIDIISIAGNHGRNTLKPETKGRAVNSYDLIVSDFLEMQLKSTVDTDRVKFYAPASPDAVFSVYGWNFLNTHGDNIGSRGGQGFVGVAATAARGMKKLVMDYAARGITVHYIIINHFHTALQLEEGFVNGCLPGPSEFSRDGRYRPRPASQLFLAVHPRRGISQYRFINVGDPSEGSLYVRPEPTMIRPQFNINSQE